MHDERVYQVALSMVPGIGDITAKTLLSYCGSAAQVFLKPKGKLAGIPGIGSYTASNISDFRDFDKAQHEIERCAQAGVQILFITDPNYPRRLKHAPDGPLLIYFKGKADLNQAKAVAIVGTRRHTSYGADMVEELVAGLKAHNPLLVSGLAYGIDICAHKAGLKNGLENIGVLASGLDKIYPDMHREIAYDMMQHGGLITENTLGTKPESHFFPARNRIIAGMTDLTIVVEAAEKGGALITAELANSYDREVFAVPGSTDRHYSKGCNNLIKQNKAHLITSVADIEYVMNWDAAAPGTGRAPQSIDLSMLDEQEQRVIQTIQEHAEDIMIDELSWKAQIPLNKLAALILNLEFKGLVKSLPGKKYKIA